MTIFLFVIAVRPVYALLSTDLVVVYNKNIPESKGVARYYASKRGVQIGRAHV